MTTNALPSAHVAGQQGDGIVRYTFGERVNHWIGALSYCYLLVTGLGFWSPYLFWLTAIVGGGPTARFWHPILGLLFTVSIFWTFFSWRSDMAVDQEDRLWADRLGYYIRNQDEQLPPTGRFNYGQKIFFWGIFYSVILLLLSGLALWFTDSLSWNLRFLRYAAILIHAIVALITIGLFLIHVYMSAILEEGSFASMIHGTVSRAWARTFHRRWYEDVTGTSPSKR
jgi:formate dehydrogenase subunit gamma